MANGETGFLSIACPGCGRKLKAPERLLGKTLPCPACKAPIVVTRNVATNAVPTLSLDQATDEFGFQLAPLVERPSVSASSKPTATPSVAPLDDSSLDLNIPPLSQPVVDARLDLNVQASNEFRFPCKVCGTILYARPADVGKSIRCSDCFSQFSIPSPPKPAPKCAGPTLDGAPNVALEPLAPPKKTAGEAGRSSADEYLARAEQELNNQDDDTKSISYDFDTAGWIKNVFSFLGDPSLIGIGLVCGFMFGGVLVAASFMQSMLGTKSEDAGSFGAILVLIFLGTPLLIGNLSNGVPILEMAANQMKRVARWPMFNPVEMMSEITIVAAAFAFAALPGGLLGWLVTSLMEWDRAIALALVLMSTACLFPILLLGMLDNQSVGQPISGEVMRSIPARSEAWAAMYLLTGLAMGCLFLGWLGARGGSTVIKMTYGMTIPFLIYFIFHQIGILASRISFMADQANKEESVEKDDA